VSSDKVYEPIVLALGNFDGVHIGHKRLLERGLEKARLLNVSLAVLLFDPHPLKILYPERELNLLTGRKERLKIFEEIGVDIVYIIPFTHDFSITSPHEFIDKVVLRLNSVHLVVGFNYSFGIRGIGKPQDLVSYGEKNGFGVSILSPQMINGRIISSSEIRKNLIAGDILLAKEMMGRSPSILGTVVNGDKRGRILGFPTANIRTDKGMLIPKNGVYAVTSKIGEKTFGGMMNIGYRPTFDSNLEKSIEVNFFDFSGDLYGLEMKIEIQDRLRAEKKFSGVEEIIAQLNRDKENALKIINSL